MKNIFAGNNILISNINSLNKIDKYLTVPMVEYNYLKNKYYLNWSLSDSIGKVHTFYGNFGILVRAYVYIRTLGDSGLKAMSRNAIINANYVKSQLSSNFDIPFSEGTLHEFVASGIKQKNKGVKALDIAKALLDYGFHAPTIYFPSKVPEAMMIEPPESESKATLDRFVEALLEID